MIRLHAQKWNQRDREYTMLIFTEEDILNEVEYRGAGFELVVLPAKFKDLSNEYLDAIRMIATVRCGEIIYV
jgi:hypothetical protein